MPNITSKNSSACGNDKCGTFAPVKFATKHPGGKPVLAGLHSHKKGTKPHAMVAKKKDSDNDYD